MTELYNSRRHKFLLSVSSKSLLAENETGSNGENKSPVKPTSLLQSTFSCMFEMIS